MRGRTAIVAACNLALALALGPASAQSPPLSKFSISVAWTGAPPERVYVDVAGTPIRLDQQGTAFVGTAPFGDVRLARAAVLVAGYSDGAEVTLPLRFTQKSPKMDLRIYNGPGLRCIEDDYGVLERGAHNYTVLLRSYFQAKQLAMSGACLSDLARARVVRAWFDRSAELADLHDHIDLDQQAKSELERFPSHAAHARVTSRRLAARYSGIDYQLSLALSRAGDVEAAVEVNEALTERLLSDPGLAVSVERFQHVDTDRLAIDLANFEGRLASRSDR